MKVMRSVKRLLFHEKLPGMTRLRRFLYRFKPYSQKFDIYYREWAWGSKETRSGTGSTLDATRFTRPGLQEILRAQQIRTMVDVPCGDFNWMKLMDLTGIDYLGLDIVPDLVADNSKAHSTANVRFACADVLKDRLPTVDLILCRDCLIHYRSRPIFQALKNFRASGSRLLLTTTYPYLSENTELSADGLARPINLEKPPYNLPAPIQRIDEQDGGKMLGLWSLSDLQLPA